MTDPRDHPCVVCGDPNAGWGYGPHLPLSEIRWWCLEHRPAHLFTRCGPATPEPVRATTGDWLLDALSEAA